jgi:predicted DCC family thiol-disulfide oxidoreductase YuxK
MKTLYVLYDSHCGICRQCRRWLERQPAFIELRFLALDSPEIACRFPGIEAFHPREQLLVISEEGAVYQGPHAWIMCLYALREYREWSQRLASPTLLPLARRACELVSDHRLSLSEWAGKPGDDALAEELARRAMGPCKDDCSCR